MAYGVQNSPLIAQKGNLNVLASTVRPSLVGLTTPQLEQVAEEAGHKPFRGRQLADWVYGKAARDLSEFQNLPNDLLSRLGSRYAVNPLYVEKHLRSSDDVDKLLVHSGDRQVFECVLLPYEDRVSCCLSSQVGCPMGCTFCATGLGGYDRNLEVSEIVGQYLLLQRLSQRRISHVVFMGMGEPMLNLHALLPAMRILHEEIGLSYRHLTVSTVGLVPAIERLAEEGLPIHLALSLHSPFDEVRDRLMPVNKKWPVAEVVASMRRYQKATGRKVTFEYLLIDDLNDTPEQAKALAELVKGLPCVVNLIPFNYVDTNYGYRRPQRKNVRIFRQELESKGVKVTERVERGHDIAAACGQLAGEHAGRFAKRRQPSELPVSG